MTGIYLKRIYDPYSEEDGERVLIDRIWPRGVSKAEARLSFWEREIAPDTELRKWFNHKPERFQEFKKKYLYELQNDETKNRKLNDLVELSKEKTVTLLFAAKDPIYNHAQVLQEELNRRLNS